MLSLASLGQCWLLSKGRLLSLASASLKSAHHDVVVDSTEMYMAVRCVDRRACFQLAAALSDDEHDTVVCDTVIKSVEATIVVLISRGSASQPLQRFYEQQRT
jgi:hypothetical protein